MTIVKKLLIMFAPTTTTTLEETDNAITTQTTVNNLEKRSQNLSCINFSKALSTPFNGENGNATILNAETIRYKILNYT